MSSVSSASSNNFWVMNYSDATEDWNNLRKVICGLFGNRLSIHETLLAFFQQQQQHRYWRSFKLGKQWSLSVFGWDFENGWRSSLCTQENVGELLVEQMRRVAADYEWRCAAYKTDLKVLNSGFWYRSDYFKFLKEKKKFKKIEDLRENGIFFHGYSPIGFELSSESFNLADKNVTSFIYQLKTSTLASEGLRNMWNTLCFIDCAEGIQLAYYEALREMFGDKKFNHHFRANGPSVLCFKKFLERSPVAHYMKVKKLEKGSQGVVDTTPLQIGDAVYFKNDAHYWVRHEYTGEWSGFHLLCSQAKPSQKFLGFGGSYQGMTEEEVLKLLVDGFKEEPLSKQELYPDQLANDLDRRHQERIRKLRGSDYDNKLPPGMDIVQEYIQRISDFIKAGRLSVKYIQGGGAGCQQEYFRPNLEAIQETIREEIKEEMDS